MSEICRGPEVSLGSETQYNGIGAYRKLDQGLKGRDTNTAEGGLEQIVGPRRHGQVYCLAGD